MLVSVIMAAYNSERFIAQAINSVLRQTHDNFELIVVDDGSTDGTAAIIAEFRELDPRIRIISQQNQGAGAARNIAVTAARSEWIAVMDSDDIMEPTRLERQLLFIKQHPDLAIGSSLVTWINEHGKRLGQSSSDLIDDMGVQKSIENNGLLILCHPACLIRKQAIEAVGGYRWEFWPSEDIDLFVRIAETGGRILVQPEHLLRYRIHPASGTGLTSGWDSSLHEWIRECSRRRKSGLPEPTYEELQSMVRQRGWLRRLDQRRRDLANILYNKATFAYSTHQFLTPILLISCSTILDPTNAPGKIWRKFLHPRVLSILAPGASRD
jgi:GT2 family glycosyltransferase